MNFKNYTTENVDLSLTVALECGASEKSLITKSLLFLLKKKRKFAFTLAEVLITLTIIGVIASMTVPTLVSKYTKQSYVVGLKKAYSVLSQVLMKSNASGEGLQYLLGASIGYEAFHDSIHEILRTYLNVVEECSGETCAYLKEGNRFCIYSKNPVLVTADGMYYCQTSSSIYVDVNGLKGPNKAGRDIFMFEIVTYPNQVGVPLGTLYPSGSKIARKLRGEWAYWKGDGQTPHCSTTNLSNSLYANFCTGRVLEEGKMDY